MDNINLFSCERCSTEFETLVDAAMCLDSHHTPDPTPDSIHHTINWTTSNTKLLINNYSTHIKGLSSKSKIRIGWAKTVNEFRRFGYNLDIESACRKWYNLMKKYREVKDILNRSGSEAITWEYFGCMDEVMANDASIRPASEASTCPLGQRNRQGATGTSRPENSSAAHDRFSGGRKKGGQQAGLLSLLETEFAERAEYRKRKLDLLERLVDSVQKK